MAFWTFVQYGAAFAKLITPHQLFKLKSKEDPPMMLSIADDLGEELLVLEMLDLPCPMEFFLVFVALGFGAE